MKVRYKKKDGTYIEGFSHRFNPLNISEVIAGFEDESYDSCFIKDLDVFIDNIGWIPMNKAFEEKHIIPDNYNILFRVPDNEEAKERGYNW